MFLLLPPAFSLFAPASLWWHSRPGRRLAKREFDPQVIYIVLWFGFFAGMTIIRVSAARSVFAF